MNGWLMAHFTMAAIGFGIVLSKHGEPRDGKHNIWVTLIATALTYGILYKAGLFGLMMK